MLPSGHYYVLECFPTVTWRSAGLAPLPAKSKRPNTLTFASELASGEVQVLLPQWHAPEIPIQLVSPPQRRNPARLEAFADAMAAAVAAVDTTPR